MNGFDNFLQLNNPDQSKLNPAQWKEFQEFKDEYTKSEMIRNHILQDINDNLEGGLTSRNFASSRNTIVFNESDSLDSDYPFIMDFAVLPETIKIAKVEVSFKIKKFRAYDTAAKSGGGATSGPTGSASGGGATSGSGGQQTSSAFGFNLYGLKCDTWSDGTRVHIITDLDGVWFVPEYAHYAAIKDHTHTVVNHTHSTPNHTHPNHTHSTPDHTHDITYGIYEEDTSPTIHFWISERTTDIWKGKHGGYTEDKSNIDITSYLTDGNGEKMLKFTSDVRCRISARVLLKLDIKAR